MTIGDAARAAGLVEALARFAADHDVTVIDPVVLSVSSNVVVHLRPAPVVARVASVTALGRDRPDLALAREVALAEHLIREGVATIAPSRLLPPGPHDLDGRWATFFDHEELVPVADADAERVGHALADLLVAAATLDDPRFDRTLGDETTVALDRLRGRIADADHDLLCAWAEAAVGGVRAGRCRSRRRRPPPSGRAARDVGWGLGPVLRPRVPRDPRRRRLCRPRRPPRRPEPPGGRTGRVRGVRDGSRRRG